MKLYIAQLFAFAGMLAGRIASSPDDRIEWAEVAKDARQAGQAFVDSGRSLGPPRQWPRAPERPARALEEKVARFAVGAPGTLVRNVWEQEHGLPYIAVDSRMPNVKPILAGTESKAGRNTPPSTPRPDSKPAGQGIQKPSEPPLRDVNNLGP